MTTSPLIVPDRTAVYYPRIHFNSLEWLKGTLLAFGRVYRIVPGDHPLDRDPPELRTISERHGAEHPLVFELEPELHAIEIAQARLNEQLSTATPAYLRARFGIAATAEREAIDGPYEIHKGKLHEQLFGQLTALKLAWPRRRPSDFRFGDRDQWLRVHPELGDAIMSVSAIASAKLKGSDVVTDAEALHGAVAALDDEAVLRSLLSPTPRSTATAEPALDHITAELAHVVMTTHFDVNALSFAEIAELVRDGIDLRAFRQQLATFAQRVAPELDQHAREERLEQIAQDVVSEWKRLEKGLPKKVLSALGSGTSSAAEDLAKEALKGLATLGVAGFVASKVTSAAVLAVVAPASVPIAFAVIGAATAWRRTRSEGPYRYLTRIRKAGGISLSVPCSYRRPAQSMHRESS